MARALLIWRRHENREVVIITIPMKNIPRLPAGLFDGVPDDAVVVDTGNYYPQQRDGRIDAIEDAPPRAGGVPPSAGARETQRRGGTYGPTSGGRR
jgi:8-hydroxy-5-deazaflavin:NADPH oxidoreductase